MATTPAPSTPAVPSAPQSTTSKPYDPMKTVDGMFKGSVMRMAYAFKDPKSYGESTRLIISECTKKYQDALDDCEIQILDAKWYLEHKLAENKARRDAKAKEASAATIKRKHEETAEKDVDMAVDSPPKRSKLSEQPSPKSSSAAHNLSATQEGPKIAVQPQNAASQQAQPTQLVPQPVKPQQPTIKTEERNPSTPQPPIPSQVQKSDPPLRDKPEPTPVPLPMDEFPKQTPNVTPVITNDEFMFESMFSDALGDDDPDNKNDMDIGLDDDPFGDDFGDDPFVNDTPIAAQPLPQSQTQTQRINQAQSQNQSQIQNQNQNQPTQKPTSTTSTTDNAFSALLEGVEDFANQPDDTHTQRPGGGSNNGATNINASTADIDMGTNIFDSFLNDEFDVGSNHGGDFGNYGDGDGGDVNFDDLFGDGS